MIFYMFLAGMNRTGQKILGIMLAKLKNLSSLKKKLNNLKLLKKQ